ncbi:MAG: DMT family transporter, partial [Myxococcales bacterium]|nr:DMT family transporter [Myxococcales bacterium]
MLQSIPIGARYMVLSALSFSGMTVCVKLAGQRLPTSELVTARALVTFVASLAVLRYQGRSPWGTRPGLLAVRGLFGFGALCCVYTAIQRLPIAEATVLQFLHPVFTAVLAALLIREPLASRLLLSVAVCLCGTLLVARPAVLFGGNTPALDPIGVAAGVSGAVLSALAYVTVRKLSETEHPDVIVFYFPLIALPMSLPALATEVVMPVGTEWLLLLLLGLLTQAGQLALTHGIRAETAGRAASFSHIQIVFATLWGVLVFDEQPHALTVLGSLLIVGGALLNLQPDRPPQP